MFHAAVVPSFWVVFCSTSLAFAQDPPPLEAPQSEPGPAQVSAPQAPRPASPPAAGASQVGPTLVIPGVTIPSPRSGASFQPPISEPSRPSTASNPAPEVSLPALSGPSNLGSPFRPTGRPQEEDGPVSTLLAPIPLTIEPIDDEPAPAQNRPKSTSTRNPSGRPARPTPPRESAGPPAASRPAPWRIPGFLGRALGRPSARSSRDAAISPDATNRASNKSKSESEPEPEPEPDDFVQRRIEKQIRTTLGEKVQSVRVRVDGRNVVIGARATWFWQKRSVYRSLESLPALTGLRARIDLEN